MRSIVINPNPDIEHLKEFPVSVAGDMFLLNISMFLFSTKTAILSKREV